MLGTLHAYFYQTQSSDSGGVFQEVNKMKERIISAMIVMSCDGLKLSTSRFYDALCGTLFEFYMSR